MTESKTKLEELKDKIDKASKNYPKVFPKYDTPYKDTMKLVETVPNSSDLPAKEDFEKLKFLLSPLIKIINYKSQKPFPEDCYILIKLIAEIKEGTPNNQLSDYFEIRLKGLLDMEGIGLPTASAIMHFCHPHHFPIVDRYVDIACNYLVNQYGDIFTLNDFVKMGLPAAATSVKNKINKYRIFMKFISKLKEYLLDNKNYTLKEIDNALMVLGKK